MANVLTRFLVGIGWDTSEFDAGSKKIEGSFRGVRTSALSIGAALLGAAAVTNAVAGRVDQLALRTEKLNTSTDFVYKYGNALRLLGGDAADAVSTLESLEGILTTAKLTGEIGPLNDLPMAGIDTRPLLQAATGQEFIEELADQVQGLNKTQKQLVQSALGLSDAAMRSLAGGSSGIDNLIAKADDFAGGIEKLTEESRKLMQVQSEFGLRMEGFGNQIAEKFMGPMIRLGEWTNAFLDMNKDSIDKSIEYAAENPQATAALGAGAASYVAGGILSKVGLGTLGGAASTLGLAGVAGAGSVMAADVTNKAANKYIPGYTEVASDFDSFLESALGIDRLKGPSELLRGFFGSNEDSKDAGINSGFSPSDLSGNRSSVDSSISPYSENIKDNGYLTPVIKNDLTLKVELGGRQLDAKILEVTEKQGRVTMGNIQATTVR